MVFIQFITIYNKISEISTLVAGKYFSWKSKMTDLKLYIKTFRFYKDDLI